VPTLLKGRAVFRVQRVLVIAEEIVYVDSVTVEGSELGELVHMPEATTDVGARFSASAQ